MLSDYVEGAQSGENSLSDYEFIQIGMDFPEEVLRKSSHYEDGELYEHDHKFDRKSDEASAYDGCLVPFVEISPLSALPIMSVFYLFDVSILPECLLNVSVGYKS